MKEEFLHKWKSQVKKGTLSFIVIKLLKNKEMYGYELIEQIFNLTSIDIAEGTLYPLLNKLKADGVVSSKWVEQNSGIPRKYYSLTTAGEEILQDMQTFWDGLNESIDKL